MFGPVTAEPSATTSVGTLLNGTYLLERVIAEGGMGVVYEAQHLRLPRKFAVKVLGKPKDAALVETALPRFRREAEIAATLAHPHIVEVFDFQVSDGGSPYLVMELLDGEDLSDRLKRCGRLPIAAALRVVQEIALALDIAHERGVVHRDLKPANIFLCKRGDRDDFVKVLDFGVSKLIDAATLTQEKAMVGTPLYMSPEQAVGTQELSAESDVFSLGSIAYEILTGRRAFAASSIPSILYQIVHGPTPRLSGRAPGLGPDVDEVFGKVLAKKKRDRFARASNFALALTKSFDRPPMMPLSVGDWTPINADERNSGLVRIGAGMTSQAAMTEIDQSTHNDELGQQPLPPLPLTPSPANLPLPPSAVSSSPSFDGPRSLTGVVVPGRKRGLFGIITGTIAATVVVAGVLLSSRTAPPTPAVAPATAVSPAPTAKVPAPAPAPAPAPTPVAVKPPEPPPQKPLEFAPDPVSAAEPAEPTSGQPVAFIFHVVPKNAQVTVDDKRVPGTKVVLPFQKRVRRVRVVAAGYRPILLTVPSTANRTFEMHMERLPHSESKRPPAAPPRQLHESAPVQEL